MAKNITHMNDLISVVIPTYNRASLITDALESVYAQNYRPIELIVVDDGSTDETKTVVKQWKATHTNDNFEVQFIRQQNQGGNPARNNGIEHACGKYIAFLDSDDAWHPEKLTKQLSCFDDPEVGGVYCGVQHMDFTTGKTLEPNKRSYPEGWLLRSILIRDITAQTSAYIIRKDVFKKVGQFDITLQARQDWDMWIRLASGFKIAAVSEVLVNFREHTGIRTASDPMKEISAYRTIRKKYAHLLKQASLSCRLQARSSYWKRMGRVHYKHNSLKTSKGYLYACGAILVWPLDFDAWAAGLGMLLPKNFRQNLHRVWNTIFGATPFAIRSH